MDFYEDVIEDMVEKYTDNNVSDWNRHGLNATFCPWLCTEEELAIDDKNAIITTVKEKGKALIEEKRSIIGDDNMQDLFRFCLLRAVDMHWTDHIDNMEQLKRGIHLRGYGQKDPVVAYRNEGYELYDDMNEKIQETCIDALLRVKVEMRPATTVAASPSSTPRKNSITKKKRR
jgi:preprotein translocase subunit SecA